MHITTTNRGADHPFERDRHLVLRAIPEDATIVSAVATAVPVSADDGGRFLESIDFNDDDGTWGANKRAEVGWVEVDLRARRRLVSVQGMELKDTRLLVDLGGGFNSVDNAGGLGTDTEWELEEDDEPLPGLTVSGLRLSNPSVTVSPPTPNPDIERLIVSSPPSNVTLAVAGGPTFWTHFGELVDEAASPDFSELLQEALTNADVEHGHRVIGLVLHSDSLARIDLTLDIEYRTTASATPDGIERSSLAYGFGSTTDSENGALSISVPRGSMIAPGSTTGRVQGAFAPTRILHGPVGRVAVAGNAELNPAASHAQRFTPETDLVITSVDVMVAAITSSAELSVDLVGDLDGKPDQVSLLQAAASRSVSRDEAADATWVNVALPGEVELRSDRDYWLVAHARQGKLNWAGSDDEETQSSDLQSTTDGGLSWREAGIVSASYFRLRHNTPTFEMPLELRIDAGAGEVSVDLTRFERTGTIDFDLDFPEVAEAINRSLHAAGVTTSTAEHLENGDFQRWYRSGSMLSQGASLASFHRAAAGSFSPDGGTVYAATNGRFEAFDTYCQGLIYSTELPIGQPTDVVVHPSGQWALVTSIAPPPPSTPTPPSTPIPSPASVSFDVSSFASTHSHECVLTLIDLASGRSIDNPVTCSARLDPFQHTADRTGLYVAINTPIRHTAGETGLQAATDGPRQQTALVRISWADLRAGARAGHLKDLAPRWRSLPAGFQSFTVAPGGDVAVVGVDDDEFMIAVFDAELQSTTAEQTIGLGQAVAVAPMAKPGRFAVLGESELLVVEPASGRLLARQKLLGDSSGRALLTDPLDGSALVFANDRIMRLSVDGRSLSSALEAKGDSAWYAMSPTGNRVLSVPSANNDSLNGLELIHLGLDLPTDWQLTAGLAQPGCGGEPLTTLAVLGNAYANEAPVESAMSQVVPVDAAVTYRFGFDGLASVPDATAQVLWRTEECGAERVDSIPIDAVVPVDDESSIADVRLRHYERVLQPPPGAVSAEVRFHTHDGAIAVDNVSLAGTTDATSNTSLQTTAGGIDGWSTAGSPLAAATDQSGATTLVAGNSGGTLVQVVPVDGSRFRLDAAVQVQADEEEPAVVVEFFDASGAVVGGTPVRVPLSLLTFDTVVAQGDTPDGALDARISLEVPASASITVERLALSFIEPVPVSLDFVSQSPGQLTVSNPTFEVDEAPPSRPPVPQSGLCPPTAPGAEPGEDCHSCYCPCCHGAVEVVEPEPVETPGGRPADAGACPDCGTTVVVTGGRPTASGPDVIINRLPTFRVVARAAMKERPRERLVTVDLPMTAIRGIGDRRVRDLADRGINTIVELAKADVETAADVVGISNRLAADFIDQARRLVRDQGTIIF